MEELRRRCCSALLFGRSRALLVDEQRLWGEKDVELTKDSGQGQWNWRRRNGGWDWFRRGSWASHGRVLRVGVLINHKDSRTRWWRLSRVDDRSDRRRGKNWYSMLTFEMIGDAVVCRICELLSTSTLSSTSLLDGYMFLFFLWGRTESEEKTICSESALFYPLSCRRMSQDMCFFWSTQFSSIRASTFYSRCRRFLSWN